MAAVLDVCKSHGHCVTYLQRVLILYMLPNTLTFLSLFVLAVHMLSNVWLLHALMASRHV